MHQMFMFSCPFKVLLIWYHHDGFTWYRWQLCLNVFVVKNLNPLGGVQKTAEAGGRRDDQAGEGVSANKWGDTPPVILNSLHVHMDLLYLADNVYSKIYISYLLIFVYIITRRLHTWKFIIH